MAEAEMRDGELLGPQKGTGTESEIDELAKKDSNEPIEDDVNDSEADAAAKKQAMALAKDIVTAGDEGNLHPTEIMPALWALTVYKGVRGFSFVPLDAENFEIYLHGSKKRIPPKDGEYDLGESKNLSAEKRDDETSNVIKNTNLEGEEKSILSSVDKEARGTVKFSEVVSTQKIQRHLKGSPFNDSKGYFDSIEDAQKVLDSYNSGNYRLINENPKQHEVTIEVKNVTGTHVSKGMQGTDQLDLSIPTNIFTIQSSSAPKPIPVNPKKGIK